MAADNPAMAHLDQLLEHMDQALKDQNWELIGRLSPEVKPAIEPLLEALEQGQLSPEVVRSRLERVQEFVDAADGAARQAKAAVQRELKEVSRSSSAAKAYNKVSSSRP